MKRIIVGAIAIISSIASYAFSGSGAGTVKSPYLITSADELFEVRSDLNAYYKLMNDIDLRSWLDENSSSLGWAPIGTYSSPFNGTFDGNGKIIKNLIINRGNSDHIGLFGYTNSGTFKNIIILNPQITGNNNVGCIIGTKNATNDFYNNAPGLAAAYITNCYVIGGLINGNSSVGGIIGHSYAEYNCKGISIESCHNSANIIGHTYCGGISGYVKGLGQAPIILSNCYSIGDVIGDSYIGGIAGYYETAFTWISNYYKQRPDLTIQKNYVRGNIKGNSQTNGIVGFSQAKGWDSGNWGSSTYEGTYNCSNNVCIADTIKGDYRITSSPSSNDNYASISTVLISYNGSVVPVEDNISNGTSMGNRLLQKAATYQSLNWDFSSVWKDMSSFNDYPVLRDQSASPTIELFESKSKGYINGTTPFSNGTVYVIVNNIMYESPIEDGKWEMTLGNIAEGQKATILACENEKIPSTTIYSFAVKNEVIPDKIHGDSNSDGVVDAADVVGTINYILGKPSSSFNQRNADVNEDGQILVDDAVGTVNIIMNNQ